jgi:exopolysaccharide biosynthesis protein
MKRVLFWILVMMSIAWAVDPFRQKAVVGGTTSITPARVERFGVKGYFFNVSNGGSLHVYSSCQEKQGTQVLGQMHDCVLAMNGGPFIYPQFWGPYCMGRVVSDRTVMLNNASANDDFGLTTDGYWSFGSHNSSQVGFFSQLLTGFSLLVRAGQILPGAGGLVAPRTMIGTDAAGHLLMFQVDGAERKGLGVTLAQAALWFQSLGAFNAVNFDGGGSSTTFYKGHVINCPTCVDYDFCCIRLVPTIFCVK